MSFALRVRLESGKQKMQVDTRAWLASRAKPLQREVTNARRVAVAMSLTISKRRAGSAAVVRTAQAA
jgi:hypothetical protein